MVQEALSGSKKVLGATHPNTMVAQKNLSIIMLCLEWPEEAEAMCQEALTVNQDKLGQEHSGKLSTSRTLDSIVEQRRALTRLDSKE